jgi:hypothetical protein
VRRASLRLAAAVLAFLPHILPAGVRVLAVVASLRVWAGVNVMLLGGAHVQLSKLNSAVVFWWPAESREHGPPPLAECGAHAPYRMHRAGPAVLPACCSMNDLRAAWRRPAA